jgi:hypothetical protein
MLWKDTKTAEDAKALYDGMWGLVKTVTTNRIEWRVRGDGLYRDGEFWFDAIRKARVDPIVRLSIAEEHLPLPGAFQEAAVSLRALIRRQRSSGEGYLAELEHLHSLAAIWSFCVPFASRLQQPGYNVMARVPFAEFKTMDLTWNTIGCEKLTLLAKTDRRLMLATWGAPCTNATAHDLYRSIWDRYEDMVIGERARDIAPRV